MIDEDQQTTRKRMKKKKANQKEQKLNTSEIIRKTKIQK